MTTLNYSIRPPPFYLSSLVWCYQSNTQPWKNRTLASPVPAKTKKKFCLNDANFAFACSWIQKHPMICSSIVNACPGKLRTNIWWKYIFRESAAHLWAERRGCNKAKHGCLYCIKCSVGMMGAAIGSAAVCCMFCLFCFWDADMRSV